MKKLTLLLPVLLLTACADPYPKTVKPDYTIHVVPTAHGDVAVAPQCPGYAAFSADPYDNQPMPQFGCASARNLALMVERPDDLVQGRPLDAERGVNAVGTIKRYDNNQTRGLIYPSASPDTAVDITTAPTPNSAMSGGTAAGGAAAPASSGGSP